MVKEELKRPSGQTQNRTSQITFYLKLDGLIQALLFSYRNLLAQLQAP